MTRRRKHLQSQVRGKLFELPKALAFLKKSSLAALYEERTGMGTIWSVEISVAAYRLLLNAKAKSKIVLAERASQNQALIALREQILKLEAEIERVHHEKSVILRQHNEFAKQVVTEKGTFRPPKSSKNYFAVADDKGTNFGSPAIQGGSVGLEKK